MRAPEWLYSAGKGSTVNMRDICAMLGVGAPCLKSRIVSGLFPKADHIVEGMGGAKSGLHLGIRQWKVTTVIKYFEQLKQKEQGKQK
jgi:hypothetical protein